MRWIKYVVATLFTVIIIYLYISTALSESRWILKIVYESNANGEANFYFDRSHGFHAEDRIRKKFHGEMFSRTITIEIPISDDVVSLRWDPLLSTEDLKYFRIKNLAWVYDRRLGLPFLNKRVLIDISMMTSSNEVSLTTISDNEIGMEVKAGAQDPMILLHLPIPPQKK